MARRWCQGRTRSTRPVSAERMAEKTIARENKLSPLWATTRTDGLRDLAVWYGVDERENAHYQHPE